MFTRNEIDPNELLIQSFFRTLHAIWGPQHWWPADTSFEVIAGAFLTQNTAWTNVTRALRNLRSSNTLTVAAVREVSLPDLERLVRPAGYFRQKAARLKNFVAFLDRRYQGSLSRMFNQPTSELRSELLGLNGVGPETADSILLYAGNHPVFVVDAYTRRIVERHAILPANADYEEIRSLFEQSLSDVRLPGPPESIANTGDNQGDDCLPGAAHLPSRMSTCERSPRVQVFNEMHAFNVGLGKKHCFKRDPQCDGCPLRQFLPLLSSAAQGNELRRSKKSHRSKRLTGTVAGSTLP